MTTLADVAKLAHVSKMTVSRAINHPEQVSPEVRVVIEAAIKQLNYQVNRHGLALRNQKFYQVQFLMLEDIETTDPYYAKLTFFLAAELQKFGYILILSNNIDRIPKQIDGVIVSGARGDDYQKLEQLNIPVVIYGEINSHILSSIDIDNTQGTYLAANQLTRHHYTNLFFLDWSISEPFARHRRKGFELFATEHPDLSTEIISFSVNDDKTVRERLRTHRFSPNTGIIATTDRIALGALQILHATIPDEIGLIGFDGVFLDQVGELNLTTIKQPLDEIAHNIVLELNKRFNGGIPTATLVSPKLSQNGTTIRK